MALWKVSIVRQECRKINHGLYLATEFAFIGKYLITLNAKQMISFSGEIIPVTANKNDPTTIYMQAVCHNTIPWAFIQRSVTYKTGITQGLAFRYQKGRSFPGSLLHWACLNTPILVVQMDHYCKLWYILTNREDLCERQRCERDHRSLPSHQSMMIYRTALVLPHCPLAAPRLTEVLLCVAVNLAPQSAWSVSQVCKLPSLAWIQTSGYWPRPLC